MSGRHERKAERKQAGQAKLAGQRLLHLAKQACSPQPALGSSLSPGFLPTSLTRSNRQAQRGVGRIWPGLGMK